MNQNYKKYMIIKYIQEIQKKLSNKGFVIIGDGSHLVELIGFAFIIKNNQSYYFDSFGGGSPDKFLLQQLPKPIIYHNFKIQHINSQCYAVVIVYTFSI